LWCAWQALSTAPAECEWLPRLTQAGGKPGSAAEMMTFCHELVSRQRGARGRVAVVAGATRGAARGIAAALGEAGATVICSGRSTRSHRSAYDRAETIEETAELVTQLGRVGSAAAVDHLDPEQVHLLVDQIRTERGHIDVPVNDIRVLRNSRVGRGLEQADLAA
jgi:NAD(P)-dependent dehydrogenase (short-subunit alcohol dehydrogenase family)